MPATLRAVPPSPPPDREDLRAAIAAVAVAGSAVAQARAARERVHASLPPAIARMDEARAALNAAESDGQQRRLARLLGAAEEGPSIAQLRQALADAEAHRDAIWADEALLDAEIERRERVLAAAVTARTTAVGEALRPTAASMLAAMHDHAASAAALRTALAVFPGNALPFNWDAARSHPDDPDLIARWRAAAAALAENPAAPIPEGDQI